MLLAAGAVAGRCAVVAKWLVVGRIRTGEHPLWSSFVWRNEVSDTFVETVAAPWFARAAGGHRGDEPVVARAGRDDRPRHVVRNLLAAGGRPGDAGQGQHRQPWLRGADASVPRPDHADGHRRAGNGRHPRPALRRAAGRPARRRRDRRSRVAGHARRRGAARRRAGRAIRSCRGTRPARRAEARSRQTAASRKPPREGVGQEGCEEGSASADGCVIDPYLPNNGNFGYRVSRYELDLEYKVAINRLSGSATITAVTLAELRTFTLDLSGALSGVEGVGERRAARPFRLLRRQVAHRAGIEAARRRGAVDLRALRRLTATLSNHFGAKSVSRSSRTARWSPANPTARRRGFPATTTPAPRPASASRSAPKAPTGWSPTASWCPAASRAAQTTWTYEQPEPTSTYLATLQIGRYEHAAAGEDAGADAGGACPPGCATTSPTTSPASRR